MVSATADIPCCHLVTFLCILLRINFSIKKSNHFVFWRMLFWNCVSWSLFTSIWRYFLLQRTNAKWNQKNVLDDFYARRKLLLKALAKSRVLWSKLRIDKTYEMCFFPLADNNSKEDEGPKGTVPTLKKRDEKEKILLYVIAIKAWKVKKKYKYHTEAAWKHSDKKQGWAKQSWKTLYLSVFPYHKRTIFSPTCLFGCRNPPTYDSQKNRCNFRSKHFIHKNIIFL